MKISLLCSDPAHPVNGHLTAWVQRHAGEHDITLARRKAELPGGDLLFLVSCSEIVTAADRAAYRATLVLHASDLPRGRGWSPHVWELSAGEPQITMSLLEAADQVDTGRIWKKLTVPIPRHALWDEINAALFDAEMALIDFAVAGFGNVRAIEQDPAATPSYFRRRTPEDSRIDPHQSIAQQFDLMRVCDPIRFPAFFELHGHRYKIFLEKMNDPADRD
jgi:methionyl-tRNA formyltransferase